MARATVEYVEHFSLRISRRLAAALVAAAREHDRTISEHVRELLRRELLRPQPDDASAQR